ncbi:hypothetical protein HYU50_01890 [Candidatus Woesearchaeota archaeon]|nr:hypothetical protein [Candidatus Woesearchaeota archaeon]
MANKKLVNYIQEQTRRGFDAQTIKNYLLRYGYSPADVDEAIKYTSSPEVRHIIHFSPTTLIGIAAIFVVMIAAVVVTVKFLPSKTPSTLLDLNLESVKTTADAGAEITFISELDNLGSLNRYDVNLRYELINTKTNNVLTFKEETRAIETKGSKQVAMEIPPGAEAGDYVLRAIATYNGQRAVATLPVKISGGKTAETEEEIIEEQNTTVTEEEQEEIIQEKPGEKEGTREETAGTSAINTFETLEKVEQIAKQNSREAEKLCNQLQLQTSRDLCFNKIAEVLGDRTYCIKVADERTKDVCLSNVAKIAGKSEICGEISKDNRKDTCYMNFVIDKKDYTVCDKVTNQYLRQSCESLKQLSKLNITDVAFYEVLVNQSLIQLT